MRNILNSTENSDKNPQSVTICKKLSYVLSTKFYTKIHNIEESTIKNYIRLVSYKDWLNTNTSQNYVNLLVTSDDYRRFCRLYYIIQRRIPTLALLIHYCGKSVTDNYMHPIISAGFTWKQLPGTKKAIIVEKTEQFHHRIQYLQNMKEWRKNNIPILYVEFMCLTDILSMTKEYVAVAVSTLTGLVHTTFLHSNFKFCMHWLKTWTASFIKDVSHPHVIVFGIHAEHKIEYKQEYTKLTMSSPKKEMVEWLENNDIPHNPNDHRAELYRLVQKFRNKCKPKHNITEKINTFGHHVVEQPRGISGLTMIYAKVKSNFMSEKDIYTSKKIYSYEVKNFLKEITLEEWRNIDAEIKRREERIYQDDMEMETVLDKLMELGKGGCVSGMEIDVLDDFTPLLGRNKYSDIIMID